MFEEVLVYVNIVSNRTEPVVKKQYAESAESTSTNLSLLYLHLISK